MYNEAVKKKIADYFISKYNCQPYNKGWYKGNCPQCGQLKFGFRLSDFRANCFKCGSFGNPLKAIMTIEGFNTLPEVYHYLKTFEGTDYYQESELVELKKLPKTGVKLPESYSLLSLGNSITSKLARGYMRKRGFNTLNLSTMSIGYCTSGDYAGMIILPFYKKAKLIYYIGRRFLAMGENKFKNPNVEDFGIGKSELIFNEDALQIYSTIYVVESVINALTIGPNAIAILGKAISQIQLSKILRSPCKRVIICLDPDAYDKAINLAFKLIEYKDIKVIKFPEDKDVNNLGKKWVKQQVKSQPYLTTYGQVKSLKLEEA